jgi:hypothetical protein
MTLAELDFKNIDTVGQAFADEIFRSGRFIIKM